VALKMTVSCHVVEQSRLMLGGYSLKWRMHSKRSKEELIFQEQNPKLTTPLRHISVRKRWKRGK
jgi:hypothetical protein